MGHSGEPHSTTGDGTLLAKLGGVSIRLVGWEFMTCVLFRSLWGHCQWTKDLFQVGQYCEVVLMV